MQTDFFRRIDELLEKIKSADDFDAKANLTEVLLNVLRGEKKKPADKAAMLGFAMGELEKLINLIPTARNYREKSKLFNYEDKLLGLVLNACPQKDNLSDSDMGVITTVVNMVENAQYLEHAVDEMFEKSAVSAADVQKLLDVVRPVKDEYQRTMLYYGIVNYRAKVSLFSDEAKKLMSEYLCGEMKRFTDKADALDEEEKNGLEMCADVCKNFPSDELAALLKKALSVDSNTIRYYVVESLLSMNCEVDACEIEKLAGDLVTAEITYGMLLHYKKSDLFPKKLQNAEYLAKSDLVRWLIYPTELGKMPDEIQHIGEVKSHGESFHVFKFKSDSDNLDDALKGEWLIGWSGSDGGTFSNFDKLSDFDKGRVEKTLKNIKKKLIG